MVVALCRWLVFHVQGSKQNAGHGLPNAYLHTGPGLQYRVNQAFIWEVSWAPITLDLCAAERFSGS